MICSPMNWAPLRGPGWVILFLLESGLGQGLICLADAGPDHVAEVHADHTRIQPGILGLEFSQLVAEVQLDQGGIPPAEGGNLVGQLVGEVILVVVNVLLGLLAPPGVMLGPEFDEPGTTEAGLGLQLGFGLEGGGPVLLEFVALAIGRRAHVGSIGIAIDADFGHQEVNRHRGVLGGDVDHLAGLAGGLGGGGGVAALTVHLGLLWGPARQAHKRLCRRHAKGQGGPTDCDLCHTRKESARKVSS